MSIPSIHESLEIDLFDETLEQKKESLRSLAALKGTDSKIRQLEKLSQDLHIRIQSTQDLRERIKIHHETSSSIIADSFKVMKPVTKDFIDKKIGSRPAKTFSHVSSAVLKFVEKDPLDATISLAADYMIGSLFPLKTLTTVGINISGSIAKNKEDLLQAATEIPSQIGENRAYLECDYPTPEGAAVIGSACVHTTALIGETLGVISESLEGFCKFCVTELGKQVCKDP